jgi:hypothetical protein
MLPRTEEQRPSVGDKFEPTMSFTIQDELRVTQMLETQYLSRVERHRRAAYLSRDRKGYLVREKAGLVGEGDAPA